MKKAISVIIPCYNCEKYIRKTLESVINQTFKDFEVIIVNDGSKDKSINIIEKILTESNTTFKIINQKNGGVSKARNNGLKNSKGKYVYMIDSDDLLELNFFEEMYSKLEEKNLDMIFSGHDRVDETGKVTFIYNKRYKYIYGVLGGKLVIENVFKNKMLLWTGSVIYRKDLLDLNNIRYTENCSNGEDQEFWIKALANSERVASINKILAHYTQREKSITHSPSLKRFTALGAVNRTKKYLSEMDINKEMIELIENYKYQKEFIYNFSSISIESSDIKHLDPIIKSKNIKKKLKQYKMQSLNMSDMKIFIAIKMYLLNPLVYSKILNKLFK